MPSSLLKATIVSRFSDEPAPEEGSNLRSFTFAEGENPACCQIVSRDRETVSSFLLQTAPIMNFGAVYDVYGEPDYLGGEQVNDEQGYVALVYSDLPLILYAFVDKPATGAISVTSQIYRHDVPRRGGYARIANLRQPLSMARVRGIRQLR